MKKFLAVVFGVLPVMTAVSFFAAIQYKVETFSGGSWFSVDERQTVYLNFKDPEGASVVLGDSVITNIGWYNYGEVVRTISPVLPVRLCSTEIWQLEHGVNLLPEIKSFCG
ncbi:MAG: hypothetical protein E7050_03250 [Lentisphaerae bacterium]|nr:hypothetical protein [Lentisphaerota bacterium]